MAAPTAKCSPVLAGDFGRAKRAGEDRDFHFYFFVPSVLRLGIDGGEGGSIGVALDAFGQAAGAHSVALDVEVGIVNRIVLVGAGGNLSEWPRVD